MKNIQHGLTLIELLVVLAIVGILVTIGAPDYSNYVQSSKVNTTTDMANQQLLFTKNEALRLRKTLYFTTTTTSFCISTIAPPSGTCDVRNTARDSTITLALLDTTTGSTVTTVSFDGIYGTPSTAVTMSIKSANGKGKAVAINQIGLIKTSRLS